MNSTKICSTLLVAVLTLISSVSAQETVRRVAEITFKPNVYVYQKGTWVDNETARKLNDFLAEQSMPVILVIADSTGGETFTMPDQTRLTGYAAADFSLGPHGLMSQSAFKALVNKDTGLPHGSVIFVSPEPQGELNGKRPWNFYSSPYLDSLGLGWKEAWLNDLEEVGVPYLKKGEVDLAVKFSVESYIERVDSVLRGRARAAALAAVMPWAVLFVLVGLGIAILWHLRLSAMKAKESALAKLSSWRAALAGKSELLAELHAKMVDVFGGPRATLVFEGEDREVAEEAIHAIDRARLLMTIVIETFQRAERLVDSTKLGFLAKPYDEAIAILRQPLRFDPQHGVEAALTGDARKEQDLLWAPLSSFESFETNFDELIETFNRLTKEGSEALERVTLARSNATRELSDAKALAEKLVVSLEERQDEEWQRLASLVDETRGLLLAAVTVSAAGIRVSPLSAVAGARALAARALDATECLERAQKLLNSRATREEELKALRERGGDLAWSQKLEQECLTELGVAITAQGDDRDDAAQLAEGSIKLADELLAVSGRVKGLLDRIDSTEASLAAASDELTVFVSSLTGENSGGDPDRFFITSDIRESFDGEREPCDTPVRLLSSAMQAIELAQAVVAERDGSIAKTFIEVADEHIAKALSIVKAWRSADERYQSERSAVDSDANSAIAKISEATRLLQELRVFDRRSFGDSVEDGKMLKSRQTTLQGHLDAATKHSQAQQMLAADGCLTRAKAETSALRESIQLVQKVHEEAFACDQKNQKALAELATSIEDYLRTVSERTRKVTIKSLTEAQKALNAARRSQGGDGRNVREIEKTISEISRALEAYATAAKQDSKEFEAASNAITELQELINEVERAVSKMLGDRDGLPDTQPVDDADGFVKTTKPAVARFRAVLNTAHEDWFHLEDQVTKRSSDARRHLAALRKETERGEQALQAIENARTKAREARAWSGRFVSQTSLDSSVEREIRDAESSFRNGHFSEAFSTAGKVLQSAVAAIASAAAEEARRKRREEEEEEESRRAERARAARHSKSYSTFSSSSSSWGDSSSWSSGGGGSGITSSESGGGGSGW